MPDFCTFAQLNDALLHALQRIWRKRLLVLLAIAVLVVAFLLRIAPYVINSPEFEVGFDTGIYERFLNDYRSSEFWRGSLPAYPSGLPDSDSGFVDVMEPGFFVEIGLAGSFSNMDIHDLFRYYLPALTSILTFCVVYVVGRELTNSDVGGLAAGFLFAVSYIQFEAVNESYYKQIFGILAFAAAVYGLDRYFNNQDKRYFFPSVLLGGSIYFYHRPTAFVFFLLLLALVIFDLARRRWSSLRSALKVAGASFVVTLPMMIPRLEVEISTLKTALYGSVTRVGMYGTEEGSLYAGGATPGVLQGFNHVLLGYILVFLPIIVLAAITILFLRRQHRPSLFMSIAFLLSAYIGLWLYFGNRLIYVLDIVMTVLAGAGLIIIWQHASNAKSKPAQWRKLVAGLIILLFAGSISFGVVYQAGKEPYISGSMEGVEWVENNIDVARSVIFAPDYISSALLQKGYTMAIWDFSLASGDDHPIDVAEAFILEAPSNWTYMTAFLSEYPWYRDLEIFVIWGTADLQNPLVPMDGFIPFGDYENSPWFELAYSGSDEILRVYRYVDL